jgi:hypothetical protein
VTTAEATQLAKIQREASSPEDLHAQMFYMYMPIFRRHLERLNKKALIRLIGGLVEVPLNEKQIKTQSKTEQDAFQIGDQLLTSKYVMLILTDAQTQMKAAEEKTLDKTDTTVVQSNTSVGEVTNG